MSESGWKRGNYQNFPLSLCGWTLFPTQCFEDGGRRGRGTSVKMLERHYYWQTVTTALTAQITKAKPADIKM